MTVLNRTNLGEIRRRVDNKTVSTVGWPAFTYRIETTIMLKDRSTALVIYEDRPRYEVGLKLLTTSLLVYASDVDVHIFAPNATPDFRQWISDRPVNGHYWSPGNSSGFNVKPDALLWALERGYQQAIWLDDDIILTHPLPQLLLNQPAEVMVAAEISRTFQTASCVTPWGFELGRKFPVNPSACCFRVTPSHRSFLHHWKALLDSPDYRHCQTQPRKQRPTHMLGSDAVLHAMLGSKTYRAIPIHLLKMGRDIAQCPTPSHYGPLQRLMSLWWGVPPLIHAIGRKPWLPEAAHQIYQSLSPYACASQRFRSELGGNATWLDVPQRWATWYRLMRGHPSLTTLPFAFARPNLKALMHRFLNAVKGRVSREPLAAPASVATAKDLRTQRAIASEKELSKR